MFDLLLTTAMFHHGHDDIDEFIPGTVGSRVILIWSQIEQAEQMFDIVEIQLDDFRKGLVFVHDVSQRGCHGGVMGLLGIFRSLESLQSFGNE